MVVNRFDQYLGWSFMAYGVYNLDEVRFLCGLLGPGDVVLDVGANIGALTVPMAQVPGIAAVHAFEPQPRVRELLEENVRLTTPPDGPVVIHAYALGSAPGQLHVPDMDYTTLGNFGGVALGDTGATEVDVRTLDSLCLQKVTLIKIDVEGAEAEVLRGARETIARCRPILYVENDRTEKEAGLLALLDELGYDHEPHWPPLYSRENPFRNPTNLWPNMVSKNLHCRPRVAA
jgi:FkbM family methyltransferase